MRKDETKMKFCLKEFYVCSVCGKKGVKLWRPYGYTDFLVCAVCAEERQSPCEYHEIIWVKESDDGYIGKKTGKMLPLPKWHVDEKGHVPSYRGPGPDWRPCQTTDQLIVNLGDVSKLCTSKTTYMVPAIPTNEGEYLECSTAPEHFFNWWNELPTRLNN